jgi:serine carboxypeptidase-like clade 1
LCYDQKSKYDQGYVVGNPSTGESIDDDSKVPYLHGVGIIPDQLYEVFT